MNKNKSKVQTFENSAGTLIFGIGNNGRCDDGLGWAFINSIKKDGFFKGKLLPRYQLQIEDAERISHFDQVIFVDAYKGDLENGFEWKECEASNSPAFTTHNLAPDTIVYLCQELYHKFPKAYTLLIQGEVWDLNIGMTSTAQENLRKALRFFNRFNSIKNLELELMA